MNLKSKLNYRVTATCQLLTDTSAILSDEVSPTPKNALRIIEAKSKQELWNLAKEITIQLSKPTRFAPIMCFITDTQYFIVNCDTNYIQTYELQSIPSPTTECPI